MQQVKEIVAETLHELIDPLIYDEAATLIEEHHLAGRDVVIVSTSGAEVVEPIGEMLGADRVIATRMVVEDGRYTGEIEYYAYGRDQGGGDPGAGRGRGLRPRRAATPTATRSPTCPMLEAVGHPYAVNPDRALRKEAIARDWPVLVFTRPVRLRDRFSAVTPAAAEHAGGGRSGRRSGHGGRGVARDPSARGRPTPAPARRPRDTPSRHASLGKEPLTALPPEPMGALHSQVKHGSWAPTRRPAHVRAGEPGSTWSPEYGARLVTQD